MDDVCGTNDVSCDGTDCDAGDSEIELEWGSYAVDRDTREPPTGDDVDDVSCDHRFERRNRVSCTS